MKILLLTTHLNKGGIGVYTVNLARHLKSRGIGVTVASGGGNLESVLASSGIRHVNVNIKTKSEFGPKVWAALPRLVRLAGREHFDLVHAQTRVAQVLAHFTQKFTNVPYVSTCHGFFKHKRLARKILPAWGEKVIAISKSVRQHLIEDFSLPPGKVTLIYNGIDLERYLSTGKDESLMERIGLSRGDIVLGNIGRISPVKGLKYLISAFKEIASKNDKVKLLIVGEGPEEELLKKQVEKSGISDKVLMTSREEPVEKYFAVLDIFCLPSLSEGLGFSLMEAMASGKACVASDVGGISELIAQNEDGILVPAASSEALTKAFQALMLDEPLRKRLGEKAREKAKKNFSIEEAIDRTIQAYQEVIYGGK